MHDSYYSRQGPYFSVNGNNGTHTGDGMVFPLWFKSSSSPTSISYRLGLLYTVHPPLHGRPGYPPWFMAQWLLLARDGRTTVR